MLSSSHFVGFCLPSTVLYNQIRGRRVEPASPTASFVLIAPGEMAHAGPPAHVRPWTWCCSAVARPPRGKLTSQIEHYISGCGSVGHTWPIAIERGEQVRGEKVLASKDGCLMLSSGSDRAQCPHSIGPLPPSLALFKHERTHPPFILVVSRYR